ncbi:PAS domain S-box protein [Phenylobacterium sp.]|uniref:PAS domain S-box protein n=1 Tax=Phenylobacterium sp. TaxID=1871053 RepID=UPI003BA8A686
MREQAEEALLKAGALQSAIFNSANFSSIATDANGVIQIFNVGAEQMLGYAAAEVMNKITPADISDPQELIARAEELSMELGTPITPGFEALVFKASRGIEDIYELTYIRKDGSRFPAVVSVTALRDVRGDIIGYLLIGTDNTARKQAEEALLKAGALQSAIFNSANFSSIATDANGVIQIFNVGAEQMLGYAAAEVMNKITPADISDPQELIARADELSMELGTPITPGFEALVFKASRGIEDIYELTYIRKDGSRFPAVVSVTALRDVRGGIIGYLLIGTDNTARKQVEEEQKKSDQKLRDQQFYTRSLIESNIDALMTTDPSGIITDVNRQMEALTGCTRDELIGAPFKDYFTDPRRAEAAIKRVLREKSVTDYELTARARDGVQTVVSYNATTFYDRNRKLEGVFAAARDVTERKRFEAELQQARAVAESASRTKSDFLASMSHEIRTPMNAIMGIADLLAKTSLTAEQDKYVQIFRRAGDNLLNLINDILDLSKVEASQLELEQTGFRLNDHLEKVIEIVAGRAQEKGLTLDWVIASDVHLDLVGDPTRLRQVLLNLLGNAIKFTETGGVSLRVELDTESSSPTALRFVVTDTGIGIPQDKLGRVFERFTQADSSTTRRFGGSGLGLTICKRLVELMGGRIWAQSEMGTGSVFTFTAPLEVWADVDRPVLEQAGEGTQAPLPPLRILLAEDSPDNCTITLAYLEDTPYQVEIAENGAVACEMFAAARYDLVLMDRQMPVMDGLAATRTMRAFELANGRAPTPIVALTAAALKGDRETCLAAGCTAFLTKPIKQDVLLRAIREQAPAAAAPPARDPAALARKIAARVPAYLRNCRQSAAAILEALDGGDFETVTILGHNMRGSGLAYGFQAITDLGAALEAAAETADLAAARQGLTDLTACLDRAEAVAA